MNMGCKLSNSVSLVWRRIVSFLILLHQKEDDEVWPSVKSTCVFHFARKQIKKAGKSKEANDDLSTCD
jgi:hypothetical protein